MPRVIEKTRKTTYQVFSGGRPPLSFKSRPPYLARRPQALCSLPSQAAIASLISIAVSPALISEPLIKDLKLTPGDLGILSAAFFFATAALQLPIGVWLDRNGPRRVQGLLMFSAVIGAALFALTDNIVLLTIARTLIGIGAAGGFMAGLKAIALWFPAERVALANSWLVMFGSLGACLAPGRQRGSWWKLVGAVSSKFWPPLHMARRSG